MSFARNFALGQQAAEGLIGTYRDARQKRDFGRIRDAKPEEITGYTDQDATQLHNIANATYTDADGNKKPYYNLEAGPDGSYGLKTNFAYQGADGQQVQPGGIATTFQPRAAVDFLGARYAAEDLTPERMEGLRARAYADAISGSDPIKGLQMRQSIKSGERDDTRFGWEEQQQPLKQRGLELGVRTQERQDRAGERIEGVQQIEDAAMAMPEEEVRNALSGYLNTNKSDLPIMLAPGKQTKNGLTLIERNPETGVFGEPFTVPLSVGRKLVVGQQLAAAGKGAEALQYLSGVDANITAIIENYTKQNMDVARFNNDVVAKDAGITNDNARTNIARAGLNLSRSQASRPQWREMLGPNGETMLVDLNAVLSQGGIAQLPEGVRMPKLPQALNDQEKIAYTKAMDELALLGEDAPPGAAGAIYKKYGLDPARFGAGAGMSGWGQGGSAAAPGGTPAGAPAAGGAKVPEPPPTAEQNLRILYDNWMRAKGPWYLPTPKGNVEAREAERAYMEALQEFNTRRR